MFVEAFGSLDQIKYRLDIYPLFYMIQFFGADFTEKDVDFSLIQIKIHQNTVRNHKFEQKI